MIAIKANFFFKSIFDFFAAVDSLIYGLISLLTGLIINVADVRINVELVDKFVSRIFVIIGIFMVFKLMLSLLNAVVNPDALTDKENGTGKIVVRVITSMILLLSIGFIFEFALNAQEGIVKSIPRILLGTGESLPGISEGNTDHKNSSTEAMAAQTFKAFLTPNPEASDSCQKAAEILEFNTISSVANMASKTCEGDPSVFMFNYSFGISGLAGLFLCFVLISYCVDIAVRVIKLTILQMLSPIPIISYADPKTAKTAFSTWLKMCTSTYIDLFVKLAVIYFAIFLLGELTAASSKNPAFITGTGDKVGGLTFVLLVVGIFYFAKSAPKFIGDIFGIKLDSGGSLLGKAMGKAGSIAGSLGGAALGAATGGAGGLVTGAMQTGSLKGALAGGTAGLAGGAANGLKGGAKSGLQYGNQSNALAQKITGDPKRKTGIAAAANRALSSASGRATAHVQGRFDKKGEKKGEKSAEKRDAALMKTYRKQEGLRDEAKPVLDAFDKEHANELSSVAPGSERANKLKEERAGVELEAMKGSSYMEKLRAENPAFKAKESNINSKHENNKYVAAQGNREKTAANKSQTEIMAAALEQLQKK